MAKTCTNILETIFSGSTNKNEEIKGFEWCVHLDNWTIVLLRILVKTSLPKHKYYHAHQKRHLNL